jgi:hypothetical protein
MKHDFSFDQFNGLKKIELAHKSIFYYFFKDIEKLAKNVAFIVMIAKEFQ